MANDNVMDMEDLIVMGIIGLVVLNLPGLGGVGTTTHQPITLWQKFFNASGYVGGL